MATQKSAVLCFKWFIAEKVEHYELYRCPDYMWRQKIHTVLGRAAVASSSKRMRGASASIVSADQSDGSLQDKEKHQTLASSAVNPASTESLSYPKVFLTSWIKAALWRGGMYWQEAISCRVDLRTSESMWGSWEGWSSHTSSPSLDTSSSVSVEKFFPCKYTVNLRLLLHTLNSHCDNNRCGVAGTVLWPGKAELSGWVRGETGIDEVMTSCRPLPSCRGRQDTQF